MKIANFSIVPAIIVVTLSSAAPVRAGILPPASYAATVSNFGYASSTGASYSFVEPQSHSQGVAIAQGSMASAAASGNIGLIAQATTQYSFEVFGPPVAGGVTLHIKAGTAAAAAGVSGTAWAFVRMGGQTIAYSCAGTTPDRCPSAHAPADAEIIDNYTVNRAYEIDLGAVGVAGDGTGSAFADPYIFVDPNFENAQDYSVVVSDNASNQPVPEPAGVAMVAALLLGFGLTKSTARRYPATSLSARYTKDRPCLALSAS